LYPEVHGIINGDQELNMLGAVGVGRATDVADLVGQCINLLKQAKHDDELLSNDLSLFLIPPVFARGIYARLLTRLIMCNVSSFKLPFINYTGLNRLIHIFNCIIYRLMMERWVILLIGDASQAPEGDSVLCLAEKTRSAARLLTAKLEALSRVAGVPHAMLMGTLLSSSFNHREQKNRSTVNKR
jgi:hypothetical protein